MLANKKKEKEEEKESQIDSTVVKDAAEQPKPVQNESQKKVFTDEEERKIQDDAFDKVDKELLQIFGKIQEKAEFLIKLQIPLQFLSRSEAGADVQASESKSSKKDNKTDCVQCVLQLL